MNPAWCKPCCDLLVIAHTTVTYPMLKMRADSLQKRTRDRSRELSSRAIQRLMRRCDEMARRYHADVYIQIRQGCRHYEYDSAADSSFPLQREKLVSPSYVTIWCSHWHRQGTLYPPTVRRTPSSFSQGREGQQEIVSISGEDSSTEIYRGANDWEGQCDKLKGTKSISK